jgi:hypothetical protein
MGDKQALERYRYMLRTAPPDAIERAHEEAFAELTPDQPGTMERAFGGAGVPGLGSMFLATLAGAFVGSAIANAIFDDDDGSDGDASGDGQETSGESETASDDWGGDLGDAGGDIGGGDFGGGDFG